MDIEKLKKIVKEQVELELEHIDNILEGIDQEVLTEVEYKELIDNEVEEEEVLDKIIALVRKEVKKQI